MMRFAFAAMLIPAAAAAPTCTQDTCCADIVYGMCTGNTHAKPVGEADPVVDAVARASDHTCGAGKYMTGDGVTCPDAGCDDTTCCTAHTVTAGCPAGQYLEDGTALMDEACTPCPAGTWQAQSADRTAALAAGGCETHTVCGAGKATTPGTASADATCANCAAGETSVGAGGACTTCAAGKFAAAGDALCTNCAPGKSSPAGSDAVADCVDCLVGETSVAGGACSTCDAGNFAAAGAASCTACVAGATWDDDANPATACVSVATVTDCPLGFELFAGDATTNKQCVGCAVGKIQTSATGTACALHGSKSCPAGEQPDGGTPSTAQLCEACPAGKFTAATDTSLCQPHTVCGVGKATTAGTASADATCANCPAGKTSTGAGAACESIVGYCDNGLDADDYACRDGTYVKGNYQLAVVAAAEVVGITGDCYVTGSTTDTTGCIETSAGGPAFPAVPAVVAVAASATVYGVSAVPAVPAVPAVDPVCSAGCVYVATVTAVPAVTAVAAEPFKGNDMCPEPPTEEEKTTSGAAAAVPLAIVAALVAALA